jgi:E3 ubiquitin-protein ligase UBR7
MINCFLCEDWFHNTCIQEDKRFIYPLTESDDVFVCKDCMDKAPILKNYAFLQAKIDPESSQDSADVSKPTNKDTSSNFNSSLPSESPQDTSKPTSNLELLHSSSTIPFEGTKRLQSSKGETEEKSDTSDATVEVIEGCKLRNPTLAGNPDSKIVTHALFVPHWSKELCRCQSCISEYAKQDISFLLDVGLPLVETGEDVDITSTPASSTSKHEENDGTASGLTLAEAVRRSKKRARPSPSTEIDILKGGLEAFAALPGHQAKGDVLHAYSEFSQELEKYFKKAADEGRVITASDIHQFFADLKAKRPRLS